MEDRIIRFRSSEIYSKLKDHLINCVEEKIEKFILIVDYMRRKFKFERKTTTYKQNCKQNFVYSFRFLDIMNQCPSVIDDPFFTDIILGKIRSSVFPDSKKVNIIDFTNQSRRDNNKKLPAYLHLVEL